MKKIVFAAVMASSAFFASAQQALTVTAGSATYNFPSETVGEMTFSDGNSLTIMGKTFSLDNLSIKVEAEEINDNLVLVNYDGTTASVSVAGNIAQYIDVAVSGADVTITQSSEVGDDTCGEITYRLSGSTTDGSLTLKGDYKMSIELNGVEISSSSKGAIDIQNGKRTAVRVIEGTENTLVDGANGSQKAALYCKGHLEFKQKGSLSVKGNTSHAISAKEYIEIKNSKITILGAVKDGINCNQYFLMESGDLTISGTGDDGIQVSYKDDTDREAEDTGTLTIKKGNVNISITAAACKALKADGDIVIDGGDIIACTSGNGLWDSTAMKTKASACLSADGNCTINGGALTLSSSGSGGKGISCDGNFTMNDGSVEITTTGGRLVYSNGNLNHNYTGNADNINSNYKSTAKGIKCDGLVEINGGTIDIATSGVGAEGIESKTQLTINDGNVKVRAYDDGINSIGTMYINGGVLDVSSSKGDGLDSNGSMYLAGGTLMAFGAASPECGIDVATENGYKLYFTGGHLLGAGGGNSTPTTTTGSQAYCSCNLTVTAGSDISVYQGSDLLYTFHTPADKAPAFAGNGDAQYGPGGGGGGGGWGGMNGGGLIISIPEMTTGTSYTIKSGTSSSTATAK